MIPGNQKPTEIIESLRAFKRRVYLWAVSFGLLAILVGWITKTFVGTTSSYEQIIFSATTVLCLGLLLTLWRTPSALFRVELSLFVGTALSLLARFFEVLFTPETTLDPNHLAAFSDLFYWFPLVYVLAFLIFESSRRLLVGSLIFFAASVALGLTHSILEWRLNREVGDFSMLARFYLANAAYIVLLMVSVRLNEQHVRARTLAETMTQLANTDALIQIANRRKLDEIIVREINRTTRYSQSLSVIMFDIDKFKQVNDTYGHDIGDSVLKEVARTVQGLLRTTDILGRWGGEEFLVVAPQTDSAQACRLAERLRQVIALCPFERVGSITASFGIAQYRSQESQEDWLKRADNALYTAKQGGRNQVAAA